MLFRGKATYEQPQVVPILMLGRKGAESEIMIGGGTTHADITIFLHGKGEKPYTIETVALSTIHELFHTLRLDHPFEITNCIDAELIRDGRNNYKTLPTTDPNIVFNIMNYGLISINGQNLKDLWLKSNKKAELLTMGQISFIIQQIKKQMCGAGTYEMYDFWDELKPLGDLVK